MARVCYTAFMSLLTDSQVLAISGTLHQIVTSRDIKVAYGAQQREVIKNALKKGKVLDNYRTAWLKSTRDRIIAVLIEEANKFNDTYKHDRISLADMGDALHTTLLRLSQK